MNSERALSPPRSIGGLDSDLTARARIRSAALDLFAERGVDGASIRDVAKSAGVSPGLVQHHFGTKERLRFACDDFALREIIRIKGQLVGGELENPALLAEARPELLRFTRYVARSMVDGSEGAAAMFAEMVRGTEAWVVENVEDVSDPYALAVLMVAMETGLLAMHRQLSDALGVDVLSPEGNLRLSKVKLEFYSTPLLTNEVAQHARASINGVLAGSGRDPRQHASRRDEKRSSR